MRQCGLWSVVSTSTQPLSILPSVSRITSIEDSAAHLSEEITGAARVAPIAILAAVASTSILGWILYIAISFATASVPHLLDTDFTIPAGQLYLEVLGKPGMLVIWSILIIMGYACGMAQGVDSSRVIFAFSRDNALPGSRLWKRIHPRTRTPVNAVWLVMLLSAILGLLSFSDAALTSLAGYVVLAPAYVTCHADDSVNFRRATVIALYTSYITPIFLRLTYGRHSFEPGPFSLGRWHMPIGIIAIVWTAFIIVLSVFPSGRHPTADNMSECSTSCLGIPFITKSLSLQTTRSW